MLLVIRSIGEHSSGDLVSEPSEVTRLLNDFPNHVVRLPEVEVEPAPEPAPEPQPEPELACEVDEPIIEDEYA